MDKHPNDGHHALIAEETFQAHVDFLDYSKHIIDDRMGTDPIEYKRNMLRTIFRLQHLRIEISRRMAEFVGMPPGTSVLETEKYFMKFMALQISEMTDDPAKLRAELNSMFGLDLTVPTAQAAQAAQAVGA